MPYDVDIYGHVHASLEFCNVVLTVLYGIVAMTVMIRNGMLVLVVCSYDQSMLSGLW